VSSRLAPPCRRSELRLPGAAILATLLCLTAPPAPDSGIEASEQGRSPGRIILDKDEAWLRSEAALRKAGLRILADYGSFVLAEAGSSSASRLIPGSGLHVRRELRPGVRLRRREIEPAASTGAAPAGGLHVIAFPGPALPAWIEALVAVPGVRLLGALPESAYIVWLPADSAPLLASLPVPPDLVSRLDGRDRISPDLDTLVDTAPVAVYFIDSTGGREVAESARALSSAPGRSAPPLPGLTGEILELDADAIGALASTEELAWAEPWASALTHDELSALITAGMTSGNRPLGPQYREWLDARGFADLSGIIVQVVDTGIDSGLAGAEHPALTGRLVGASNETPDPDPGDCVGHGSHIAGIIAANPPAGHDLGDDSGYSYGLGVAPGVGLYASKIFDCAGNLSTTRSFSEIIEDAWEAGARISNNSWGQGGPSYTALDREYDALVRDVNGDPSDGEQPMVVVASSGNTGPQLSSVGSPAIAKNVIAVGSTESVRPEGTDGCGAGPEQADDADQIRPGSSRGPTTDGRLKPDLVAPGSHIISTVSQSGAYEGFGLCNTFYPPGQQLYTWTSGTSQSAAHVSGAAALFMADYRSEYGALPSPAMVKAGLVAGAHDVGSTVFPSQPQVFRPSPFQGWGRVDLDGIVGGRPRAAVDQSHVFTASGQEYLLGPLRPADRDRPVTVVLAWTDAPGTPAGASHVNDLDLEVDTGSDLYLGNVFSRGLSATGGRHDARNNIEVVALPAGAAGSITIRVTAVSISGDAVPSGPGLTDQDFALYVDNVLRPLQAGRLRLDRPIYSCSGSVGITVTDRGLVGGGRALVSAASGVEPGGEAVSLAESPPGSGIFEGRIALSAGLPLPDGILQVSDGGTISVTYADENSGNGSGSVAGATAGARCLAPVISDVSVESIGTNDAVISWQTDRPADSTVHLRDGATVADPSPVRDHRVVLRELDTCSTVAYRIESVDPAGFTASYPPSGDAIFLTGTGKQVPLFSDDMEDFRPRWSHGGTEDLWELGRPQAGPAAAASGSRVWGTNLDGSYAAATDSWLEIPPLALGALRNVTLQFRHFVEIPAAVSPGDPQDGAWVEASIDGGATWIVLTPAAGYPLAAGSANPHIPARGGVFAGVSGIWRDARFDLSDLGGGLVRIRFRIWRDRASALPAGAGWYIDDVAVAGDYPCGRGSLSVDSEEYGCASRVRITLADADIDIDPGRIGLAAVIAESPFGPQAAQLVETGRDTGVYAGTLLLGASPDPSSLQVAEGDTVVITYQDADDGTSTPVTVQALAPVTDCTAPPPPSPPAVSRDDDGRLRIEWSDPSAPDLAEIRVHYDSDGPGPAYNGQGAAEGASPTRAEEAAGRALLSALPSCIPQFISLTAIDRHGNESDYSAEAIGVPFTGTPCSRATIALAGAEGVGCSQQVPVRIDDGNADTDPVSPGAIDILASASAASLPLSLSLDETGPDTGVFTGFIPLAASPTPGALQVSEGDRLTVTYTDGDTGAGGPSIVSTTVPVDDCVAPAILGLERSRLGFDELTLRWRTDEPSGSLVEFGLDPGLEESIPGPPDLRDHSAVLSSLPSCSTVYYRVTASDRRGNVSTVDDAGLPFHLGTARGLEKLADDFEGGGPGWTSSGSQNEWEIGVPLSGPPPPPSGASVFATDLDGKYEPGADMVLTSPEINLSGLESAELTFSHWYDIFSSFTGEGFDDGAWVEVSSDGGATWTYIVPDGGYPDTVAGNPYLPTGTSAYAGKTQTWEPARFDLDAFAGGRIHVRFHLYQDTFDPPQPGLGWYIDDVVIFAAAACHHGRILVEKGAGGCSGSPLAVYLWDIDGDGDPLVPDTATVRLSSPSDPIPLDLLLIETGASTGEFTGEAPFGRAPSAGSLIVQDGDLLTAVYADDDDGSGVSAEQTATALVGDCTPPGITDIRWQHLSGGTVKIEWRTDEPADSEIRSTAGAVLAADAALVLDHALLLSGLSACSPTPIVVASTDAGGNINVEDSGGSGHIIEGGRSITLFEEGFESGASGWEHSGEPDEWEIGPPSNGPGSAFAGSSAAGTGLAAPYSKDRFRQGHTSGLVSPPVSLSGLDAATLAVRHFHDFAPDTRGDGGVVEIDDGSGWKALVPIGGYPGLLRTDRGVGVRGAFVNSSGGWIQSVFDLSAWTGGSVRIRFVLFVDHGTPAAGAGWFLDEIALSGSAACRRGLVQADRASASCGPGVIRAIVADTDLDLNPSVPESVSVQAASGGGLIPVPLAETGPSTGVFMGQVPFSPAGGPGLLRAVEGELLEISYDDADDGSGAAATRTASVAFVDCTPPLISSVSTSMPGGGTDIAIRWETSEPSDSKATIELPGGLRLAGSRTDPVRGHLVEFKNLPPCSPFSVTIASRDRSGNLAVATGTAPPFAAESRSVRPILIDDMETPNGTWTSFGSVNEWSQGPPILGPPGALSGTMVLGTDLNGFYDAATDAVMRSSAIDLRGLPSVKLSFWHFYDIFASGTPNAEDDGAWIEILRAGQTVAAYVRPVDGYNNVLDRDANPPIPGGSGVFAGQSESWQLSTVDLTPFTDAFHSVQFHLWNDVNEGVFNRRTGTGWYLDDVRITSPGTCFQAPTLSSLTGGALSQGTTGAPVSVTGSGFRAPLALDAGPGIVIRDVQILSPASLTAVIDVDPAARTGVRELLVFNPDMQSGALPGALRIGVDPSRGDLDGSGAIDGRDLAILAGAFATFSGEARYIPAADLNGDGAVDGADLAILASVFGLIFAP
jgi:bacillopeptidase F (M6 metalloprotease family)